MSLEDKNSSNLEVALDSSTNFKYKIDTSVDFKSRIDNRLKYLYSMLDKYAKLNSKCNNKYNWRSVAITNQIDSLEFIINNFKNDDWNQCYEEDLRDL